MKAFNALSINVRSIEGGTIVKSDLTLDGQIVDSHERIVVGKPGSSTLGSRIRKAIRLTAESAFPRPVKVEVVDPNQQSLPLGN